MRANRAILLGSFVVGLFVVGVSGGAWAADEAPGEVDLTEVMEQLKADDPALTDAQARELAEAAAADFGRAPSEWEGATREQAGIIVQGPPANPGAPGGEAGIIIQGPPTNPGAPGGEAGIIIAGPSGLPDPGEQAGIIIQGPHGRGEEAGIIVQGGGNLDAPEFGAELGAPELGAGFDPKGFEPGQRDEGRLHELVERGVPGMERASGLEHRGGEWEGPEHPQREATREMPARDQREGSEHREVYREAPEQREMTREAPVHEEVERPTVEQPVMERPEYERAETGERMEGTPHQL